MRSTRNCTKKPERKTSLQFQSAVRFVINKSISTRPRNATDDFNLFHDPRKCGAIQGNPYDGTIVMGFQPESLIEYLVVRQRNLNEEESALEADGLGFSNYQLNFVSALGPEQEFSIEIKQTVRKPGTQVWSNRIILRKSDGQLLRVGYKREAATPSVPADFSISQLPSLQSAPDRSQVQSTGFFLKRKFFMASNAKNLLAGSLADQGYYFDEVEDRVRFPEMYPCTLLSCALLERATQAGHNFAVDPVVFTNHHISIDRALAASIHSNEALHMLVSAPTAVEPESTGLRKSDTALEQYRVLGIVRENQILYRVAPLHAISVDKTQAA